jgi:hypothetical protein
MATGTLEVIPSEDGLLVALKDEQWTAYVRGYSEQIRSVARGILAADCPWLPKDLVNFAQDVLAGRPHTIKISEWLSVLPEFEITSDDDREPARKVVGALRELRSLFHDMFATVRRQIEAEAAMWAKRGDPGRLQ